MICDELTYVPISFECIKWRDLLFLKCFLIISRGGGVNGAHKATSFRTPEYDFFHIIRVFKKPQSEPHRFIISHWF